MDPANGLEMDSDDETDADSAMRSGATSSAASGLTPGVSAKRWPPHVGRSASASPRRRSRQVLLQEVADA